MINNTVVMPTFNEKKQNERLDELRRKEEEDLAHILSGKYGLEYIDLSLASINNDALGLVGEEEARKAFLAVFNRTGKKLSVAVKSPNNDDAKLIIQKLTERGYKLTLFMVSTQSLERAWDRYKDFSFAVKTKEGVIDISGEKIQKLLKELKDLDNVKKLIAETLKMKKSYRLSRILEIMLAGAFASEASDIHIEPEEDDVRLRYRLDGVLADMLHFDRETYELLVSRIKLISGLKLNVKNRAQDGRFSVRMDQTEIEIRTSILPGAYGESAVLRILNPDTIALPMEKLGVEPKLLTILLKEIERPNGMILNTGPTGSGKTTTLYAFLKKVHGPDVKIITIEDPIEYHLEGIVQTQTEGEDYTFASGLRSALRQDPDIIMIGEIRDNEVAETAINAALTGHLVFSTLHTNTAAGAFPRLIDLNINPKVISSAVNIVMSQRLVRLLCNTCKKETPLSGEHKKFIETVVNRIVDKSLTPKNTEKVWEPVGCPACNGSGYKGRIGIYGLILMDKKIEELLEQSAGEHEIAEAARSQGILSMLEDGILKVLRGTTSLSELGRVIDLFEEKRDQREETPEEST